MLLGGVWSSCIQLLCVWRITAIRLISEQPQSEMKEHPEGINRHQICHTFYNETSWISWCRGAQTSSTIWDEEESLNTFSTEQTEGMKSPLHCTAVCRCSWSNDSNWEVLGETSSLCTVKPEETKVMEKYTSLFFVVSCDNSFKQVEWMVVNIYCVFK